MDIKETTPGITSYNKAPNNTDSKTAYTYSTTPLITPYKTLPSAFTTMK